MIFFSTVCAVPCKCKAMEHKLHQREMIRLLFLHCVALHTATVCYLTEDKRQNNMRESCAKKEQTNEERDKPRCSNKRAVS